MGKEEQVGFDDYLALYQTIITEDSVIHMPKWDLFTLALGYIATLLIFVHEDIA